MIEIWPEDFFFDQRLYIMGFLDIKDDLYYV